MKINLYDMETDAQGNHGLVMEKTLDYNAEKIASPEDAAKMITELTGISSKAEEHIYMLSLNSSCEIAGLFFISKGSANASFLTPREIFMRALLSGAVQIILFHNHPSGNCTPSDDDIKITKRIKEVGELVCISLTDHIIIGGLESGAYLSMREAGLLEGA